MLPIPVGGAPSPHKKHGTKRREQNDFIRLVEEEPTNAENKLPRTPTESSTIAAMQSLRPSLRIHVAGIAALICVTLAFVAVTSKGLAPRIFFGLFCLTVTGTLLALYRKESVLAEGHLVVSSTVTELKTGKRGRPNIKYEFVAFDGKQYRGQSDWGAQRVHVGAEVPVLYKPLDPAVNLPLVRFLFFSFRT